MSENHPEMSPHPGKARTWVRIFEEQSVQKLQEDINFFLSEMAANPPGVSEVSDIKMSSLHNADRMEDWYQAMIILTND